MEQFHIKERKVLSYMILFKNEQMNVNQCDRAWYSMIYDCMKPTSH